MPNRDSAAAGAATAQPQPRIGLTLRAARDRLGVTVIQAAERLRLDVAVIEALEQDRFEALGAPVYVRGHLRRYAEFLGETGGALEAQYAALQESAVAPDLTRAPRVSAKQPQREMLWPVVLGGGVIFLVCVVWWALRASPAP